MDDENKDELLKKKGQKLREVYLFFKYNPNKAALRFNCAEILEQANQNSSSIEGMYKIIYKKVSELLIGQSVTLGTVKLSTNQGLMKTR